MDVLERNGLVSNQQMEDYVHEIYAEFDSRRKSYEAQLADEEDMKLLEDLENEVKDKLKRNATNKNKSQNEHRVRSYNVPLQKKD